MLVPDVPVLGAPFLIRVQIFGVSFLLKSQVDMHFLGCHFGQLTLQGIDFDHIAHTSLKIQTVMTILGYMFSMACTYWGITFIKIHKTQVVHSLQPPIEFTPFPPGINCYHGYSTLHHICDPIVILTTVLNECP